MTDNLENEGLLKVGTSLANGKYRIERYLASGGFGNTYIATDTAFDELVAIKELYIKGVCGRLTDSHEVSISLTENQRAFSAQQDKFRKEARRLRKLTNNHIVQVHDLFDENNTSYYVMDFIEGESLSSRMKHTKQPLSEAEVMLLLPQILDALECVHNEKIWHLDLKPGNIMIDAKGNAKLIDFGASKQLKNSDGNSLSTSSAMAYTPGFASSEQMEQNIEKFGPWTDLYSLGATLYNLLTLQQPPSPSDIDEDALGALKMPEGTSRKTQDLIIWLMKPNRKMRPQSVADVRQFLSESSPKKTPKQTAPEKKISAGDDDTVIRRKDGRGGFQQPHSEPVKPTPHEKPAPKPVMPPVKEEEPVDLSEYETPASSRNFTKYYVAGAIAVILIGFNAFRFCSSRSGSTAESSTEQTDGTKEVQDAEISVQEGPANMRTYIYSGPVNTNGLPEGKGTAKFNKVGDIPASTYEGNFVNGLCEDTTGEATMVFTSGDKYVGTFKAGYYVKGKYTLSDGSYFDGEYKEGNPYTGIWYNADGTLSAQVMNGKER